MFYKPEVRVSEEKATAIINRVFGPSELGRMKKRLRKAEVVDKRDACVYFLRFFCNWKNYDINKYFGKAHPFTQNSIERSDCLTGQPKERHKAYMDRLLVPKEDYDKEIQQLFKNQMTINYTI